MKLNQNQELEMTFKNVLACLIFFGALIPLGFVNANTLCDDFKSQKEPTGFILNNNILNLFTSMDVLDKPGTFKSKETNLKKIYYVNLKKLRCFVCMCVCEACRFLVLVLVFHRTDTHI